MFVCSIATPPIGHWPRKCSWYSVSAVSYTIHPSRPSHTHSTAHNLLEVVEPSIPSILLSFVAKTFIYRQTENGKILYTYYFSHYDIKFLLLYSCSGPYLLAPTRDFIIGPTQCVLFFRYSDGRRCCNLNRLWPICRIFISRQFQRFGRVMPYSMEDRNGTRHDNREDEGTKYVFERRTKEQHCSMFIATDVQESIKIESKSNGNDDNWFEYLVRSYLTSIYSMQSRFSLQKSH